ncbi:hypothetical protein G4V62_12405 [Bacillaceae bacterium SIJ1]|uniref:hypothetical protein n=1 Tax=Litoribacterium kuwaitense TaxID=1398745 RepID=UPI0013ED286D|nr:hypothetical protein [Litoribacterium kuwaitense]NGP45717.1 hypothetical protein [Litoribacterium kuwaitense]
MAAIQVLLVFFLLAVILFLSGSWKTSEYDRTLRALKVTRIIAIGSCVIAIVER